MDYLKKISYFFVIFIVSFSFTVSVFALQGFDSLGAPVLTKVEGQKGEIANCFDYYKFGSLALDIYTDKQTYSQNDGVIFQGTIKNNNPYPVVDIGVYARIYKNHPNPNAFAKDLIVDEFYLDKGINLAAGAEAEINYPWMIHSNAASGDYRANFYVVSGGKFNMAGLSFTDDVFASFAKFNVSGNKPDTIYLDRTNTKINDKPYSYVGFLSPYETGKPIIISIPLINKTKNSEKVEIAYTLYYWDGLSKQNILDETKETKDVKADSAQILNYSINNPDQPVYYLQIVAKPLNQKIINITQKSITDVRLAVNTNRGRLNFIGLSNFPVKAGESYDFFACFHNTSMGSFEGGKVNAILKDKDGKLLAELYYPGAIPSAISALKTTVKSPAGYDNLTLQANIIDKNGKVVDEISQTYDCRSISPDLCLPEAVVKTGLVYNLLRILFSSWGLAILIVIIILIIYLIVRKIKKSKQMVIPGQPGQFT